MGHRSLHHARAFHHLGQKHLALAKQIAHHVHAVHQRAFDDVQRAAALRQHVLVGLFGVQRDEVGDAMYQRVTQAFSHCHRGFRRTAPLQLLALVFGAALGGFSNLHQTLTCIVAAVQHHIFHALAQHRLQIVVHADHAGVDDPHVHAGLDRVV